VQRVETAGLADDVKRTVTLLPQSLTALPLVLTIGALSCADSLAFFALLVG